MVGRLERLARFESPSLQDWIIYFGAFFLIQVPAIINFYDNATANNPYILFANALLNGEMVLSPSVDLADVIYFENQYYLPYPPLPSIILLPFVALF